VLLNGCHRAIVLKKLSNHCCSAIPVSLDEGAEVVVLVELYYSLFA